MDSEKLMNLFETKKDMLFDYLLNEKICSCTLYDNLRWSLTLKGHTSVKLHKKHTGCLTPKRIQICALLMVLDIFIQKNDWMTFNLSTLQTNRFRNDLLNFK